MGGTSSAVSQAVGVATGIQDKFSWNAVALTAITAGIGGSGIGNKFAKLAGVSGKLAVTAVGAGINSAIGQGIGVATGMQEKFSWAGVAAAGVGAGVGFATRNAGFVTQTAARTLAIAGARSLIEGTDFGDNILAALPDIIGQTIGEAIAGGIARAAEPESVVAEGDGDGALPGGRQLHEWEIALIEENAHLFARRFRMNQEDAERLLAQTAYKRINPGAPDIQFGRTLTHRAIEFLNQMGRAQRGLLPGDPEADTYTEVNYFNRDPLTQRDGSVYARTLVTNEDFYNRNGLLRDGAGRAARAQLFETRMADVERWTLAAPGIAATLVLAPLAPVMINGVRASIYTNPFAWYEGGEIAGGFLLGDALPAGSALGASALMANESGDLLSAAWRGLRRIFTPNAMRRAEQMRSAAGAAVEAGGVQRALEAQAGRLASIGAKGRIGEAATVAFFEGQGYEALGPLRNASGQGLDHVFRAADGSLVVVETKASSLLERPSVSGRAANPQAWVRDILRDAGAGTGRYARLSPDSRAAFNALRANGSRPLIFQQSSVYLDNSLNVRGLIVDRWH